MTARTPFEGTPAETRGTSLNAATYTTPKGVDAWLRHDSDPNSRAALRSLLEAAHAGDETAQAEVTDAFARPLAFGTAGIRAPMGPGPGRINQTTIAQTAAGIAAYLIDRHARPSAVIGYDGRHHSADYAHDTAAVLTAGGVQAHVLPGPLPTPVLAFATRKLHAQAGLMVTASHNPKTDNGVKVYLGDGHQIVPPADSDITERIAEQAQRSGITRSTRYLILNKDTLEAYLSAASGVPLASTPRDIVSVHTALHGVSTTTFQLAAQRAGFNTPISVPSQAVPDPDFPTVTSPNPEHPQALEQAIDLARKTHADVIVAHDPDADRCAIALPVPQTYDARGTGREAGTWTMLNGDETGWLLAWWMLERGNFTGSMAASLVSSPMLGKIARHAGVAFHTTHTGFKWISRAPELGFGYEEAIGYCVDPQHVGDKDGITAGLLALEALAALKARGQTAFDVLDDLARLHGVHLSNQVQVTLPSADHAQQAVETITTNPPRHLGPLAVQKVVNLQDGYRNLPPTPGALLDLPGARAIIRPSGTEPKIRCYLTVEHPTDAMTLAQARTRAHGIMRELTAAATELLARPEVP